MLKNKLKILIYCSIAFLVIVTVSATYYVNSYTNDSQASYPEFYLDKSKADDWWSAGNTNPQATVDITEYDETTHGSISDLPVASITVHHNSPDGHIHDDRCFISFSYYDQPTGDTSAAYSEYENSLTEWGGSFDLISRRQMTILTTDGVSPYELRSYYTKVGYPGDYMSGTQVGFAELAGGYIKIQGTCQSPEDTALTPPIMSAVSLQNPTAH